MIRTIYILAFMLASAGFTRADIVETDTTPGSGWVGFSSVAAPSDSDLAHNAFVTLEVGGPNPTALNIVPDLLTDGLVATNNDHFVNSSDNSLNRIFFGPDTGGTEYRVMINLFGIYDISTINTYSWHERGRSDQNFDVYYSEDLLPTGGDLDFTGWEYLGGFNTSGNSGDTQVVTSFDSGGSTIATAQYFIFVMDSNSAGLGSYFTEIDIYEAIAVPEPATGIFLVGPAALVLVRRKRLKAFA